MKHRTKTETRNKEMLTAHKEVRRDKGKHRANIHKGVTSEWETERTQTGILEYLELYQQGP